MVTRRITYNPAFLSEQDLVDSFVVRERDLDLVMETIRENTAASNQHLLIVGPRGMGKTMLVLRAAAGVRADVRLNRQWVPLIFSEESYEVSSPGEFWLEALFHLHKQFPEGRWHSLYQELKPERDEKRLYDRAVGHLMDFADQERKRLLVVVENLDMIFREGITHDDAWRLRHTLQNEPRIMLLATATSRFDEVDRSDRAMYELFQVHELQPLDRDACRRLWTARTNIELSGDRIRPMEILTGGNPRLLSILSSFASGRSLRKLMDELAELIDEHTAYFKTNLEVLPPAERKIFVTLADLWEPATARQVAEGARVDVSQASSMLHRLVSRGAVSVLPESRRTRTYQVTERLYNVYHLMRRSVGHDTPVQFLVDFMRAQYEPDDLVRVTLEIAAEACTTDDERRDHFRTYQAILGASDRVLRKRILESTDPSFFGLPDLPASILQMRKVREQAARKRPKPTLSKLRDATRRRPKDPAAWVALAEHLRETDRREANTAFRRALKLEPTNLGAMNGLGSLLLAKGKLAEAGQIGRRLTELAPNQPAGWQLLGLSLYLQRDWKAAEPPLRTAVKRDEDHGLPFVTVVLARDLMMLQEYEEAETILLREASRDARNDDAWWALGNLYEHYLEKYAEAAAAYRNVVALRPADADAWARLGFVLLRTDDHVEAERALRESIRVAPNQGHAHLLLGALLFKKDLLDEAAEELRTTLQYEPTNEVAILGLAIALVGTGHAGSACDLVERFLHGRAWPNEQVEELMEALAVTAPSEPMVEALAQKAIERSPGRGRYGLAVAVLRAAQRRWREMLDALGAELPDTEAMRAATARATALFVDAAAAGEAERALELLERSPSAPMFLPLAIALRMLTGKEYVAPVEVVEVARDVVKRIEATRSKQSPAGAGRA